MRRVMTLVVLLGMGGPLLAQEVSRMTPVVKAYRKAGPAVVNISSKRRLPVKWGLFGIDPYRGTVRKLPQEVELTDLGSGVVISSDGYVVTNAHVIRDAESIRVTFPDKRSYIAAPVVADSGEDIAVLKIIRSDDKPLPFLPLGRSDDLMVGETVIAVGNALGFASTVTTGVVSAVDRTLKLAEGHTIEGLIQTDASINQGNSGGPLLNIKGELIGINTAITAGAENIGFAVPIARVRELLPKLLDVERLRRVQFGATFESQPFKLGGNVVVKTVRPESPAEESLQVGDQILQINGRPVKGVADVVLPMLSIQPGQSVTFKCFRGNREILAKVMLKEKPLPNGKALAKKWLGLTLVPITPEIAKQQRLGLDWGLGIVSVREKSEAAELGIRRGDVLFHAGGLMIRDFRTLGAVLEDVHAGQKIRIGILRGNTAAMVDIHLTPPK